MRETFSADPTVVFLTSVLDDIAQGRIRIPRFQRPLVWSWSQRKEFFESIFAGLPIGALMIWATSNDEVGCYSSLGPHKLPTDKAVGETRYLMDGVQRISTLYGALRATESWVSYDDERDIEMRDFVVYADLDAAEESERFRRRVDIDPIEFSSDIYRFLPIGILLNSRELLRFQRGIGDGKEYRLDLADEVASAFREYKVPIITLNSASLEVVTKSFERVNSRGADMSELHMLNALTYTPVFDLLKRDQDFRQELLAPLSWHNIDSDIVLRCLKSNLGADIYKTNPDDVSKRLKENPKALYSTFDGIANTARFFQAKFGITDPSLVPYRIQIVAIATALQQREFEGFAEQLVDWVWLSTYSELFGGTGRQSENAITDLRNFVMDGSFHWSLREPPAVRSIADVKSDFRAARVKALMLALAKRADDKAGMLGTDLLKRYSSDAFMYLKLPKIERGDQGARFLIEPASATDFKIRLLERRISREDMVRHVISDAAMAVHNPGNMKAFTRQRARDLFTFEQAEIIFPVAKRLGIHNLRTLESGDAEVEKRASDIDRL